MPDDKKKTGAPDRKRVAAKEPYEVGYFARKHNITRDQAEKIIKRYGPMRDDANKAAERLKK